MATWNRALETLPRAELAALQLKGLRKTLRRVWANEGGRLRLMRAGFSSPDSVTSLEDLVRLPFQSAGVRRDISPLAGCCVNRRDLVELHLDPMTGAAVAATKSDLLQSAEAFARAFAMAGLEKGDAFAILEPLSLTGDGLACYHGCRKAGLFCVPAGTAGVARPVDILRDYRVKGVFASPSALLNLPTGCDLPSLRVALVPAEGLTDGLRQELSARLPVTVFSGYGRTETGGALSVAHECRAHDGLHVWEDLYLVEIVDSRTGASVADGEAGELVITTLAREAQPLVRLRTGVRARIVSREPCSCGRTSLRLALDC